MRCWLGARYMKNVAIVELRQYAFYPCVPDGEQICCLVCEHLTRYYATLCQQGQGVGGCVGGSEGKYSDSAG